MSLKKHTVVPSNTIKYVIVICTWDITGDVILQPSIKHPELLIPHTVVDLEDQQTPVKLCNLTHKFVTLKMGCNFGYLEEVDGIFYGHATVDMEANSSILQCSIDTEDKISEVVESSSKVTTLAEVAELVPNHIKDLLVRSRVNLDEEHSVELAQFLIEFADVFAKDDIDLGCFSTIQHQIDTGDSKPIQQWMH